MKTRKRNIIRICGEEHTAILQKIIERFRKVIKNLSYYIYENENGLKNQTLAILTRKKK